MTVVARRIASIPKRLASDTWLRIVELIAPNNPAAQKELTDVTGVAASIITREAPKDSPIVVTGEGPRLRLYCIYGDAAIEGEKVNETPLDKSPGDSDSWKMSLPCPAADLSWVRECLDQVSSRVTARDATDSATAESDDKEQVATATINLESFLRE